MAIEIKQGERFNLLTINKEVDRNNHGKRMVEVSCDCGNVFVAIFSSVKHGRTMSCGCFRKKLLSERMTKHGSSKTRGYVCWRNMVKRCTSPNERDKNTYGPGKIGMDEKWNDFDCFINDMGEPGPKMQIDRIDNNKGYSKDNCRWVTPKENARNRSTNRLIEYNGETKTMAEWADVYGMKYCTLVSRFRKGFSVHDAFNAPVLKRGAWGRGRPMPRGYGDACFYPEKGMEQLQAVAKCICNHDSEL